MNPTPDRRVRPGRGPASEGLLAALADIARPVLALDWPDGPPSPLAIGWATVELDRAIAEFTATDLRLGPFAPASPDPHLGATLRSATIAGSSIALVLCEPFTEGRIAASLARHGEGPAAAWLEVRSPGPSGLRATGRSTGSVVSAAADGPFGPERLVLGGPRAGPHILLVAMRGALP